MDKANWKLLSTLLELQTPWIRLVGERWRTTQGDAVDYWRTETDNSVIVIPESPRGLVLPAQMFRPGVGRPTLDFPGGRCPAGVAPQEAAYRILARELGVSRAAVSRLRPINDSALLVNSSTSNQMLYGFHALIGDADGQSADAEIFATDSQGIARLLERLDCLQCRALLLEYLHAQPWRDSRTVGDA